jgi:signal transduction histidine kinase
MRRIRGTIRFRLTVTYTAFFLLGATVLVSLDYAFMTQTAYQPLGNQQVQGLVVSALSAQSPESQQALRALEADPTRRAEFLRAQVRVEAALRQQLRQEALTRMLALSAVALALMALVSVGLGWLAAGRALRPVQEITRTARLASDLSLHQRVNLRGPQDELKDLADTIDGMLERLETAFQGQKRFVANASHELRTPLSIMRTAVDVAVCSPGVSRRALMEMALEVRTAVDRAETLMDSLLTLARSDQEVRATDYVDLADPVLDALDAAGPARTARGLETATELRPAPVRGDRALLETMVGNLVENAVRHNRDRGTLRVRTGRSGDRALLDVANSGPRLAAEVAAELFEPFRRGTTARTGSDRGVGLGLSIVRAVVVNHGGVVDLRPLPEGGLEVSVSLPAAE